MERRIRVLALSPAMPWPATTGGLVRIAELSTRLADHCDVTLVAPRLPGHPVPPAASLRLLCPEVSALGLLRKTMALADWRRPYHAALHRDRKLIALVGAELRSGAYDLVYAHFIYPLAWLPPSGIRVIVDQQNVDRLYWKNKAACSNGAVRAICGWNQRRTMAFEDAMLPRAWGYVSVSNDDREQTKAYAGGIVKHFWVAPNGVDTARFRPAPPRAHEPRDVTLGYLGSLDLPMNVDTVYRFCTQLLPQIRTKLPGMNVKFVGIGRNPADKIQRMANRDPAISFSGTVDDVVPWLQKLDVLVCPIRMGAGTKLKVAEAMACGLAVVGSRLALAGLPGQHPEHYLCADDDEAFISEVCALAVSPQRRLAIGQAARRLAEECLGWDGIGRALAGNIREALARD